MPQKAVLFDFDGVIADTENIHIAAWERTFGDLGWDVAPEVCARAMEVDDRVFLSEIFAGKAIIDGDVEGWVRRKQVLTLAMLADCPQLYPGVAQLARGLARRAKLAVVSGTWRANVETVLHAAHLEDAFAVIVGKEDVAAAKPDPEAYRLALKRLKVKATDALALEDSPTGLESARGAGVRVIAVGHRRPHGAWIGDATYARDLRDVGRILEVAP